jgi:hypothetical protein
VDTLFGKLDESEKVNPLGLLCKEAVLGALPYHCSHRIGEKHGSQNLKDSNGSLNDSSPGQLKSWKCIAIDGTHLDK